MAVQCILLDGIQNSIELCDVLQRRTRDSQISHVALRELALFTLDLDEMGFRTLNDFDELFPAMRLPARMTR